MKPQVTLGGFGLWWLYDVVARRHLQSFLCRYVERPKLDEQNQQQSIQMAEFVLLEIRDANTRSAWDPRLSMQTTSRWRDSGLGTEQIAFTISCQQLDNERSLMLCFASKFHARPKPEGCGRPAALVVPAVP